MGSCAKSRKLLLMEASTMEQNMSKNLTMLTLGGRVQCRQCQATAKHSRVQCKKAAMKGKAVCRTHGGASCGPRTAEGRAKCAATKTTHGRETRAKRAERSKKSAEFHQIVALGNALNLFHGKVKLRGRPPNVVRRIKATQK